MAEQRNCPNCGGALPPLLAHARMVNCDYCDSSVLLDDAVVKLAGSAGVMLDAPELITLDRPVELEGRDVFTAIGHVRYDYGRGHWDEYHGSTLNGDMLWVSVDEGDVVLQVPLRRGDWPKGDVFRIGAEVRLGGVDFTTTEVENATCAAFRGQLPEPVAVGETHLYANMSSEGGAILSAERWQGGQAWFQGRWIDPWLVRAA